MKIILFFVLFGIYGYGVWTFWRGFERTSFNASLPNKLLLSALWPVLLVVNKSYRQNFTKALRGR